MPFTITQKVLFKHCDPAGLVFYPRYFEMISDCIETCFDVALGHPFEDLHKTAAVPTVHIETSFKSPSVHGDTLDISLDILRVGTTSAGFLVTAKCGGETRFTAKSTLVYISNTGNPTPWPDALRTALVAQSKET